MNRVATPVCAMCLCFPTFQPRAECFSLTKIKVAAAPGEVGEITPRADRVRNFTALM
jgi:hypothetical protein